MQSQPPDQKVSSDLRRSPLGAERLIFQKMSVWVAEIDAGTPRSQSLRPSMAILRSLSTRTPNFVFSVSSCVCRGGRQLFRLNFGAYVRPN